MNPHASPVAQSILEVETSLETESTEIGIDFSKPTGIITLIPLAIAVI